MKKTAFFHISTLIKGKMCGILYVLTVCILVRGYAVEVVPAENADAGREGAAVQEQVVPQTDRSVSSEAGANSSEAELRLRIRHLEEENFVLQGELLEIRKELEKQNRENLALRLWLAGVPAEGTVRKDGRREEQLLKSMGFLLQSGNELALKTTAFCEEVRSLLKEMPIGKVRQADILLKLDFTSDAARRMIGLTEYELTSEENSGSLQKCRILAVNRELSIAVLSVGSAKGAFPGLIYRAGKNGATRLRIVSVRPFVAAAAVLSGSIADLAPGMEAATDSGSPQ
jgi:hypothetical protein